MDTLHYVDDCETNAGTPILFLAGPSMRVDMGMHQAKTTRSWRDDALKLVADYDPGQGLVVVPEWASAEKALASAVEVGRIWEWEQQWLARATVVMFWVPRRMSSLPGLTTNIEFGMLARSGKVVFGAPDYAEHVGYMKHMCKKAGVPVATTLEATVHQALMMLDRKSRPQEPPRPHCGRDDGSSPVGCCGGSDGKCSCECSTCLDPI